MPTKPLESVLYRELSRVEAKPIIDNASPVLIEVINYATNAFKRCETSVKGEENEDLALLALYLHIIEMTDGIEVLAGQSCAIPANPLLRSAFEALLYMEYIVEDKDKYLQRSLSWLLYYALNRLDMYESFDITTAKGKALLITKAEDIATHNVPLPDQEEVKKAIANLGRLLAREQFQEIYAEFGRSKKKRRRRNWYELFDGPQDLRRLSKHLKREYQYHILYNYWSSIAHAQDVSRFIGRTSEGLPAFQRLRDPSHIAGVASLSVTIAFAATHLVLARFRPGEEESMSRWYKKEVRARHRWLGQFRSGQSAKSPAL